MQLFRGTLDDAGNTLILAGKYQLSCVLSWPDSIEEEVTKIQQALRDLSAFDPILGDGKSVSDYDYMAYYIDLWAMGDKLDEYLDTNPPLPTSLIDIRNNRPMLKQQIQERAENMASKKDLLDEYDACLYYTMTVSDNEGGVTAASVKPGAWYNNQSDTYCFRFTSDLERVGKGMMSFVGIEVEVYGAA